MTNRKWAYVGGAAMAASLLAGCSTYGDSARPVAASAETPPAAVTAAQIAPSAALAEFF